MQIQKLSVLSIVISLTILCMSCSPIVVKYIASKKNNTTDAALHKSIELLTVNIEQSHYPNDKIKIYIDLVFQNLSNDTISLNGEDWLDFRTKSNTIDTAQLKSLLATKSLNRQVLPNDKIQITQQYWSNSFNGSFKELFPILKQEEIGVLVRFKIKEKNFDDSAFLQPDLTRFRRM